MCGENGRYYEMVVRAAPTTGELVPLRPTGWLTQNILDQEMNLLTRPSTFGKLEVQVYSLPHAIRAKGTLPRDFGDFMSPPIPENKGTIIHAIG